MIQPTARAGQVEIGRRTPDLGIVSAAMSPAWPNLTIHTP